MNNPFSESPSAVRLNPLWLKNFWFLSFLFFPFLDSQYLESFEGLSTVLGYWKIAATAMILLMRLLFNKKTPLSFIVAIYFGMNGLSTYMGDGNIGKWFRIAMSFICLCLLCEMAMQVSSKMLFKSMFYCLGLLVDLNAIFLFLVRMGQSPGEYWQSSKINVFGHTNLAPSFIIPYLAICILYSQMVYKKITFFAGLQIFVCLFSFVLQRSATGTTGLLIFCILWLLDCYLKKSNFFNSINFLIIVALLFFLIVIFRTQEVFSVFIENVLGKDLTLTGRVYVWDIALQLIKEHPLMGAGYRTVESMISWDHVSLGSHCDYLQIMLTGGLVGISIFIIMLIYALTPLLSTHHVFVSRMVAASIFSTLVMMITENFSGDKMLYIFLAIAVHAAYLIPKENKAKECVPTHTKLQPKRRRGAIL